MTPDPAHILVADLRHAGKKTYRAPLPPLADNAILFLWRASDKVEHAYKVARAWGFTPRDELIWCEEIAIVATRGDAENDAMILIGKLEKVTEGNPFPTEDMFFDLVPYHRNSDHCVQLFGSKPRTGWTVYSAKSPVCACGLTVRSEGKSEDASPLPFDEEDCRLAGIQVGPTPNVMTAHEVLHQETAPMSADALALLLKSPRVTVEADNGSLYFSFCCVCHEPQYRSKLIGVSCANGHGAVKGIPEGSWTTPVGEPQEVVSAGYGAGPLASASFRASLEASQAFANQAAAQPIHVPLANHIPPERVYGGATDNLALLVQQLNAKGLGLTLIELAAYSPSDRAIARYYAENGGDVPAFLVSAIVHSGCAACNSGAALIKGREFIHTGEGPNCKGLKPATSDEGSAAGRKRGRPPGSRNKTAKEALAASNGTNGTCVVPSPAGPTKPMAWAICKAVSERGEELTEEEASVREGAFES